MPAIRGEKSKKKTRRYRRDLDQIHDDLSTPRHLELYHETKDPNDLPALGEHYCIPCAKWFESEHNFGEHKRAKPHKKRSARTDFEYSDTLSDSIADFDN
jgi:bud site selection protein 20